MRVAVIEAFRGVAATAVVLSHVARHLDKNSPAPGLITVFQSGHAGVDLFFVISGFIILQVHRADIGCPGRVWRYLERRVTRVFPMYLLALSITIALGLVGSDPVSSVAWVAQSAFLLPSVRPPILDIAWTLQFEIVFYCFFALLILNRKLGLAVLIAWMVAMSLGSFVPLTYLPPQFWRGFCAEFLFGMAAAQLLRSVPLFAPRGMAALSCAMFLGALLAEDAGLFDGYSAVARPIYGLPAMLMVWSFAATERQLGIAVPGWLLRLGGASYSIYLFQFVFIGVAWQFLLKSGLAERLSPPSMFLVLACAAIGGGVAVAHYVEQPFLRVLRRAISGPRLKAG